MNWTQPSDNGGSAVTSYVVDYSSDAGETWTTSPEPDPPGANWDRQRLITELVNGAAYLARAAAVNAAGTGNFSDTLSLTASPIAPGVPDCQTTVPPTTTTTTAAPETTTPTVVVGTPGVPTDLRFIQLFGWADTEWTAPTDGGDGITSYVVEKSSDSGATWMSITGEWAEYNQVRIDGLVPYTTYLVRVAAVNAAGTGNYSDTLIVRLQAAGTNPSPGAPTDLTATSSSDTAEVSLSWAAPSFTGDGDDPIIDYEVQYLDVDDPWQVFGWQEFADGISTDTSTTVTGLSIDTNYEFRVAAVNFFGTGSFSAVDTAAPGTRALTITKGSFIGSLPFAPSESTGSAHPEPAVAIGSNGFPVIAYYGFTASSELGVKIDVCSDATCSSKTSVNVDEYTGGEQYLSLAIGNDGNPIVAYYDHINTDLKVAACGDAQCSTFTSTTLSEGGGRHNDIAIGANGNPVISYTAGDADPNLAICADPTCSSATLVTLEAGTERAGNFTSIVIGADGNPVISYYGTAQGTAPVIAACADQTCSSVTLTNIGIGPAYPDAEGTLTSMALGNDDLPIIVYDHATMGVRVAKCTNATCTTWSTLTLASNGMDATLPDYGAMYPSVAVGTTGYPFITYTMGFALYLATCADEACTQSSSEKVGTFSNGNVVTGDLVVDNSGSPVMIVNPVGGDSLYLITE